MTAPFTADRRWGRRLAGAVVAVGLTTLIAAGSRSPQRAFRTDMGALRLSWRATPERLEVCRTVPEEELRTLPAHMRQPVICDGRSAEYRLTVLRDGFLLADDTVRGGGARRDRPMYLYREFPTSPGSYEVVVRLERLGSPSAVAGADPSPPSDGSPHGARDTDTSRREALPPLLELTRRITVPPRGVVLITYDLARRVLDVRNHVEE